jgi:hypothetical protein
MMKTPTNDNRPSASARRDFLKTSSALAITSSLAIGRSAHAAGSDEIRLALVGCGGRGAGAAANAMKTDANVKLVAMADAFRDRIDIAYNSLMQTERYKQRMSSSMYTTSTCAIG